MDHKRKKKFKWPTQVFCFELLIVYHETISVASRIFIFYFTYFLLPQLDVIISSSHNDGDNNGTHGVDNSKDSVINNRLFYIM